MTKKIALKQLQLYTCYMRRGKGCACEGLRGVVTHLKSSHRLKAIMFNF